ncbi:MAG TPA: RNA methyltransferase [Brumimicrobium sp.]|nr:RNA methyltransferase [Brumimicrobium sp.]
MISKEQIKQIRSLHLKKFRDQNREFIIEGPKMIEEAVKNAPHSLVRVFGTSVLPFDLPSHVEFIEISEKELKQISVLKHPQQQIAICQYLSVQQNRPDFFIALDTIQDPGNFGTILRLASWFGVKHIMASKETVDLYNPKVVQASMGAIFNVSVEYVDLKAVLLDIPLPIYGALLNGENIYEKEVKKKGVLLMGNEGKGISQEIQPLITDAITIPQFGKGESLNVAMATAVLLSEFSRR